METKPAFVLGGTTNLVKRERTSKSSTFHRSPQMSTSVLSRRKLGQLALGTSAAVVADAASSVIPEQAKAADAKKKEAPAFVKDDSGISYYDVKAGSGPGPADGDFVVIDYVSS